MSNETKWTPGPWGIERGTAWNWIGPMRADGKKVLEAVVRLDKGTEYRADVAKRMEANARLIAQAPDMARVCELIDAHYSASLDHQPPYVALARAALAKVRGHE